MIEPKAKPEEKPFFQELKEEWNKLSIKNKFYCILITLCVIPFVILLGAAFLKVVGVIGWGFIKVLWWVITV